MLEAKLTIKNIENILSRGDTWSVRTHVIVPNITNVIGIGYEADILIVTSSLYCHEIEIKTSVADFRREFKTKADKYTTLVEGTKKGRTRIKHTLKHFSFAFPDEIVEQVKATNLIPDYAGIIAVKRQGFKVLREPKILSMHRKLTKDEYIRYMRLAYLRYWGKRHNGEEL